MRLNLDGFAFDYLALFGGRLDPLRPGAPAFVEYMRLELGRAEIGARRVFAEQAVGLRQALWSGYHAAALVTLRGRGAFAAAAPAERAIGSLGRNFGNHADEPAERIDLLDLTVD